MKGVYVFLADGFEEIEAIAPVDILSRGGVAVKTVSFNEDYFSTSSRRLPVVADMNFDEFLRGIDHTGTSERDILVFPGGMPGARNLAGNAKLMEVMNRHYEAGGTVAAICASPALVLAGHLPVEVVSGLRMTCHDGFIDELKASGAEYVKENVVTSGRIITARGAGLSIEFGLALLARAKDQSSADKAAAAMML